MIVALYLMQLFGTTHEIYWFLLSLVVIFLVIFMRLCQFLLRPGIGIVLDKKLQDHGLEMGLG